MKKVFVSLCMASVLMGLSSCASTKNAATLSSISGEWNIIEVNGTAVVPAPGQEFPYIGFDTKTGKVFGNSGCNRMMGSFDVNAKPGTIDLGALASTRMACPDMTVENNVLSALNKVKKYKKLGKENIALCGASNRPIVVLQKKESVSKLSDLEGKWIISEAAGEAIPDGMEIEDFTPIEYAEDFEGFHIYSYSDCNEKYIISEKTSQKYITVFVGYSFEVDNSFSIYKLNTDKFNTVYDMFIKNKVDLVEFKEHYIKAKSNLDKDMLIYTSIPYDLGWKVYVDGKETNTYSIGNALLGYDMPKGDHVIELVYKIPYFKLGLGISLTSLGLLVIWQILKKD